MSFKNKNKKLGKAYINAVAECRTTEWNRNKKARNNREWLNGKEIHPQDKIPKLR